MFSAMWVKFTFNAQFLQAVVLHCNVILHFHCNCVDSVSRIPGFYIIQYIILG